MLDDEHRHLNYRCSGVILSNAFDFFESATSLLGSNASWSKYIDESELKASLLSITTGVELILKAKIASFDYKRLFRRAQEVNAERLATGDFYSINFDECLEILEKEFNLQLTDNLKTKIEDIRKERNKLIHYHSKESKERFLILVAKGIDVFIEFYREHIKEGFCEEKDRTVKLEQKLFDIKAYVNVRLETIKPKLLEHQWLKTYYFDECSTCYQDAAILKAPDTVKCLFCEDEHKVEDYAELFSNLNSETKECPQCKLRSMIAVHRNISEDEGWDCIVCGYFINRPQQWIIEKGKSRVSSLREDL